MWSDCVFVSGPRCDVCQEGFYGDPAGGAGVRRPCRPCRCNGHIDTSVAGSCDRSSGECLKCVNNTRGRSCEACRPSFYRGRAADACRRKNHVYGFLVFLWFKPGLTVCGSRFVDQHVTVTHWAPSPLSVTILDAAGAERVSRVSGANGPTVLPVSAPSG